MSDDRLLRIDEAAERLQTSKDWLYRNWQGLPFARKLSRKQLRFSSTGIDEYVRQGNNGGSTLIDNDDKDDVRR